MKIRSAEQGDADGIAHVHVSSWQTTYAGIIADTVLANLKVDRRATYWQQVINGDTEATQHILVAEDENGNIVGFVSGGAERGNIEGYDGELYAIYLLKTAQGKGVGKQLFQHMKQYLQAQNFSNMALWVLKDNPSRGFYEAQGGNYVTEQMITIGDQELLEVAYGWQLNTNTT